MAQHHTTSPANNDIEQEDTSSTEGITQPFSPAQIDITTPPMNLGDLIDMLSEGWINLDTDYQRSPNLWSEQQQSRLIESALLGLRLPAFYFEEVHKRQWNIIDGLQRCCAIYNFCCGDMPLQGLQLLARFNGKHFRELSFDLRRDIRMLPITVNILKPGAPDQVKYILFQRLNSEGIALNPAEIRHALYQGPAVDTLKNMAALPSFLQATGGIPTERKQHLDFPARFTAFYLQGYAHYQPDLDYFINQGLSLLRNLSEERRQVLVSDFDKAMNYAYEIFGDDAFRKRVQASDRRKPINRAYFEVIATTFAGLQSSQLEALCQQKDPLKAALMTLLQDIGYDRSLSSGTGNREHVQRRFADFEKTIGQFLPTTSIHD